MKKFSVILLFLLFSVTSLFAEERLFSFSAGLSSGIPVYGSDELKTKMSDFSDSSNRGLVGALASINLNVSEVVSFFTGADFLTDFNWNDTQHCNILSLDFNTGIKIYPGLGGLNFGLAYSLGYSSDYYGLKGKEEKTLRTASSWGNGIKVLMEYNFAHYGQSKNLPTTGLYWKLMPRGNNNYDNHFCAYILANF